MARFFRRVAGFGGGSATSGCVVVENIAGFLAVGVSAASVSTPVLAASPVSSASELGRREAVPQQRRCLDHRLDSRFGEKPAPGLWRTWPRCGADSSKILVATIRLRHVETDADADGDEQAAHLGHVGQRAAGRDQQLQPDQASGQTYPLADATRCSPTTLITDGDTSPFVECRWPATPPRRTLADENSLTRCTADGSSTW